MGRLRGRDLVPVPHPCRASTCAPSARTRAPPTASGISVTRYRYAHTLVGGALAGVGGAYVSLAVATTWADGITAGQGWIAIALVIFGFWRPDLTLVGAYLFGAATSLAFTLQARGYDIAPQILDSLPYLLTIVVLVVVSSRAADRRVGAPAALGVPYDRESRQRRRPGRGE